MSTPISKRENSEKLVSSHPLPENLLAAYLAYSNKQDLVSARLVSKCWHQATQHPQLAHHFVARAKSSETPSFKRKRPETNLSLLPTALAIVYLSYLNNCDLISISTVCREYLQLTESTPFKKYSPVILPLAPQPGKLTSAQQLGTNLPSHPIYIRF